MTCSCWLWGWPNTIFTTHLTSPPLKLSFWIVCVCWIIYFSHFLFHFSSSILMFHIRVYLHRSTSPPPPMFVCVCVCVCHLECCSFFEWFTYFLKCISPQRLNVKMHISVYVLQSPSSLSPSVCVCVCVCVCVRARARACACALWMRMLHKTGQQARELIIALKRREHNSQNGSPTATLTWYASKNKVHKLHTQYIWTWGCTFGRVYVPCIYLHAKCLRCECASVCGCILDCLR